MAVTLDNMSEYEAILFSHHGVEAVRAYRALCNGSSGGGQLLAILGRKEVSPRTDVVGKGPLKTRR